MSMESKKITRIEKLAKENEDLPIRQMDRIIKEYENLLNILSGMQYGGFIPKDKPYDHKLYEIIIIRQKLSEKIDE